jgi:hypothetical protein
MTANEVKGRHCNDDSQTSTEKKKINKKARQHEMLRFLRDK